jgi:hypothetical protein
MQDESSDANPAVVTITEVTMKTGKTGKKDWTKYNIITDAGVIYSTFDRPIAERAKELKGYEVALTWERKGEYLTCTDIEPVIVEPLVLDAATEPEGEHLTQGYVPELGKGA